MRTDLLPKVFSFTESDRDFLVFSDGTKINIDSVNHYVTLVPNAAGQYPLDTELYVVSRKTTPGAWWRWEMLLVGAYHTQDEGTYKTSHRVRLHDGTNHRYWNGATWAVAGAGNWNTEAVVNANIKTFPSKTFAVVINLQTSDRHFTPRLKWVNVAWSGRIYFLEDIIYRTLVPFLRAVRPITEYPVTVDAATSTIDLNTYALDAGYKVTAIDSVFHEEVDADHRTDLLVSYNPGTKVVTLSSPIPSGHTAWLRVIYEPPVIVVQSTDYAELATVPAIVIENIHESNVYQCLVKDGVLNRATMEAIQFQPPLAMSLRFDIIAIVPGSVDALRLEEELAKRIAQNELLTSTGLDEQYRLRLLSEFADTGSAEGSNIRSARASAEIMDVLTYTKPAVTGLVPATRLRLTGDVEADITL